MSEKRGRGRPSSYKEEFAEQARKLCLLGADDKALADFFGVAESTLNNWKLAHADFLEALKAGKDVADAMVAESLYKRAIGYSCDETKVFNNNGSIVESTITKNYPPDPTAMIFWLKNRQPGKWRDKQPEESNTDGKLVDAISELIGKLPS